MKMNDLLNGDPDKNPFKRAETEIVNVEIKSVKTWSLDGKIDEKK